MDIQHYIDKYCEWLKSEITFKQIGEYYEINSPFLDNANDYLQFYVKQSGNDIFFTDDGFTVNSLELCGISLTNHRKQQLTSILNQYGVQLDGKDLVLKAPANEFPQKKHAFTQCLLHVNDLYMTSRTKVSTFFLDDIQEFFLQNNIYSVENIQFTGKSGFSHNYDFVIPRTSKKPERICLAINNPNKTTMGNAIFAWNDTKPSRKSDSQLIVFLNDNNSISKGVESGFSNYSVKTLRWSKRFENENLNLLTA